MYLIYLLLLIEIKLMLPKNEKHVLHSSFYESTVSSWELFWNLLGEKKEIKEGFFAHLVKKFSIYFNRNSRVCKEIIGFETWVINHFTCLISKGIISRRNNLFIQLDDLEILSKRLVFTCLTVGKKMKKNYHYYDDE